MGSYETVRIFPRPLRHLADLNIVHNRLVACDFQYTMLRKLLGVISGCATTQNYGLAIDFDVQVPHPTVRSRMDAVFDTAGKFLKAWADYGCRHNVDPKRSKGSVVLTNCVQ
jgi:hypothetical protein